MKRLLLVAFVLLIVYPSVGMACYQIDAARNWCHQGANYNSTLMLWYLLIWPIRVIFGNGICNLVSGI